MDGSANGMWELQRALGEVPSDLKGIVERIGISKTEITVAFAVTRKAIIEIERWHYEKPDIAAQNVWDVIRKDVEAHPLHPLN